MYVWRKRDTAITLKTEQRIIFLIKKNTQKRKETKTEQINTENRRLFCTRGNTVCVARRTEAGQNREWNREAASVCVWNALHLTKKQLVTLAVHSVETVRMRNTVEKCEQWSDDNYMHRNFNMSPCVILFFIWFRTIQNFAVCSLFLLSWCIFLLSFSSRLVRFGSGTVFVAIKLCALTFIAEHFLLFRVYLFRAYFSSFSSCNRLPSISSICWRRQFSLYFQINFVRLKKKLCDSVFWIIFCSR